ncbi:MAG: ComEC family competence protein [Tenericutes bacterium ADurb.Bin087]|nr:MAG: ComEC family competence protein [Tenericutes bacterium ADurb.Bin087]
MNLLFILLSFIAGLLTPKIPYFLFAFVLLLIRVFKIRHVFVLVIVSFIIGLIIMKICNYINNLPFTNGLALVTKAGQNHVVILTLRGKLYVRISNNTFVEGDVLFIKGYKIPYSFRTLEGEFNYAKYLENKGIISALNVTFLELKIASLLRLFSRGTKVISYPTQLENLKNILLTKTINYDDAFLNELVRLDLIFLITLTGAHLSFLRRLIKKISSVFMNELWQEIISYLCLIPLFLLNVTKFAFYRIFLSGVLRYINKTKLQSLFNSVELTSIAAFFFLVINPYFIFDPAFYLAYTLTFLFKLLQPAKTIKGRLQGVLIVVCVIVPYNIFKSGSFEIVYLFFSLLLVPLISIWTLLYFVTMLLPFLQNMGINLLNVIYHVVLLMKKINITLYFGAINNVVKLLVIVLVAFLLYSINAKIKPLQKEILFVITTVLLLNLLPISHYLEYAISFINVGQGDSTLLRIKNKYVLVDTGGLTYKDVGNDILIPYLKRNKIFSLDYLIITHDDFDHCGAKEVLVNNFNVKNVITKRDYFPLTINGITIRNLNNKYYDDLNLDSLILYVAFPRMNVLLMADAGIVNETELINNYPSLKVDVLKVGHHGSNTSTSEDFIRHYRPEVAIISCGYANYYGHPHHSVLATLHKYDVKVKRTDTLGTITIKTCII